MGEPSQNHLPKPDHSKADSVHRSQGSPVSACSKVRWVCQGRPVVSSPAGHSLVPAVVSDSALAWRDQTAPALL